MFQGSSSYLTLLKESLLITQSECILRVNCKDIGKHPNKIEWLFWLLFFLLLLHYFLCWLQVSFLKSSISHSRVSKELLISLVCISKVGIVSKQGWIVQKKNTSSYKINTLVSILQENMILIDNIFVY